jgi:hypothetical protein
MSFEAGELLDTEAANPVLENFAFCGVDNIRFHLFIGIQTAP